jgi:Tol biopolymer transport system component
MLAATAALAGACNSGHETVAIQQPQRVAMVYAKPVRDLALRRDWRVFVAGREGEAPRRIAQGQDPAISPDGRWVAYFTHPDAEPSRLYFADAGTRRSFEPNLLGEWNYGSAVWDPTSRRIAVVMSNGEERAIGVVEPRPGARTRILTRGSTDIGMTFSPDGSQLAFVRLHRRGADICTVGSEGGAPSCLTHGGWNESPAWGALGIAFERGGICTGDVWLMDGDGSNVRQITHSGGAGIAPVAVSSDGRRLLGAYLCPHNGKLWGVDLASGAARDLTGFVGDLAPDGISRDGRTVLASIGCGGLIGGTGLVELIPFAGGKPRVIAHGPCRASWNA